MAEWATGMTELASLFVIVFLVYLLQCVCWVSPRADVFALEIRGRGRKRYQGFVWNALDTAGLLANPFPPLAPVLVVQWPAFELSADSIQFPGKDGEMLSIPWEKLKVMHSDAKLFCNGAMVFKGSDVQVAQYAALLGQLQRARSGQREQIIRDWLRKMLNTQHVLRRVKVFARRSFWLRLIANFQFVFLFLLVPLGFQEFGTGILWRAVLMLVVIDVAIVLEFWTLHKTMFPGSQGKDQRFKSALTVLLSPIAAIRACDVAARDLLAGYHPVAVAGALLPVDEFRRFAGEQLRLCRFGDHASEQYGVILQRAIERSISQQGLEAEQLMGAPETQTGCVVYCPRCLAQYTKARDECSDCGYERLAAFDHVEVRT